MVEITPLFESTSLTPPRLGGEAMAAMATPLTPANAEALGMALLTGMLTDLASLKEALAGQVKVNRAVHEFIQAAIDGNAAQTTVNEALNERQDRLYALLITFGEQTNKLVEALGEIDARLCALDGKPRSTTITRDGDEPAGAADTSDNHQYRPGAPA